MASTELVLRENFEFKYQFYIKFDVGHTCWKNILKVLSTGKYNSSYDHCTTKKLKKLPFNEIIDFNINSILYLEILQNLKLHSPVHQDYILKVVKRLNLNIFKNELKSERIRKTFNKTSPYFKKLQEQNNRFNRVTNIYNLEVGGGR